jgi:hypothetical protein
MFISKYISFAALTLLFPHYLIAQQNVPSLHKDHISWQYGFSVKASAYLFNGKPCTRIGVYTGIGVLAFDDMFFPTAHFGYDIYLNGLGTRFGDPKKKTLISSEFVGAATLTTRLSKVRPDYSDYFGSNWNQPLYFFSEMNAIPLQNPYWNSISLGSVWIAPTDKQKRRTKAKVQRVGFGAIHINQFDFFYYNDGGPFITDIYLGDGHDRWHTGGGMLAYHPKKITGINNIELTFHKYTGYWQDAFELSDQLHLAATPYHDTIQHYYNMSDVCLHIGNISEGWAGTVRLMNLGNLLDIQHIIHYADNYAYHIVPYPWGLSFGGDYSFISSKILFR